MKVYRFKDLSVTSSKVPSNTHDMVEVTYGTSTYLIMIDPADDTQIIISDDEGANWNTFNTGDFSSGVLSRTHHITSIWYDRANDKVYFVDMELAANNDVYAWYLDLSDMSENNLGGSITDDISTTADIYIRNSTVEVLLGDDPQIYRWGGAAWGQKDVGADDCTDTSYVVVKDSSNVYWWGDETAAEMKFYHYDGNVTITGKDNITGYSPPGQAQKGLAYDGDDVIYCIMNKDADSKDYLMSYTISTNTVAEVEQVDVVLMLDRNCSGSVPNEYEKAFDATNEIIYEIKPRRGGLSLLQDISALSDASISAITDHYVMNSDGDMFKYTDVSDYIEVIRIYDGIFPRQAICTIMVHPDNESYFNEEDSLKIYDTNDVLCFWGKIMEKSQDSKGLYHLTLDAYKNEVFTATYETSYSGDDLDTKQKDIIDNGCSFCYRSSSIVGTTTTFDYEYNRAVIWLFQMGRFLERQVAYAEPDGKVYTKAYNSLTASGESWNIDTPSDKVQLVDIAELEEAQPGYFKGNTGATRATVRYKNNTTSTKPSNYAELEQKEGVIPVKEWRDPKLEASTEADQLADYLHDIFSADTIYIGLVAYGKGWLQPGESIQVQDTGVISITQDDFLFLGGVYDPKNDVWLRMILSDNIIYPKEFKSKMDTSPQQVHTAAVQSIENQSDIATIKQWYKSSEATSYEIDDADLTDDTNYNDVDISSHVSTGTEIVRCKIIFKDNAANSQIYIRDKSNTGDYDVILYLTQVANQGAGGEFSVRLDGNYKFQMKCNPKPSTWTYIRINFLEEYR